MVKLIAGISTIFAAYLYKMMNRINNQETGKVKLSKVDKDILEVLRKDATLSNKQISAIINKSQTTVSVHKRRLYELGVIDGHIIKLGKNKIDPEFYALSFVKLVSYSDPVIQQFKSGIQKFKDVCDNAHSIIPKGIMLQIRTTDYQTFLQIEREISRLPSVEKIESLLDLQANFHLPSI